MEGIRIEPKVKLGSGKHKVQTNGKTSELTYHSIDKTEPS